MARALLEDAADYVIIGTGAGGATAARVLSEAGLSVIMLEEGKALRKEERARGLLDAMTQSVRDLGTVTTSGTAPIPLLLGRCVGGGTAINSGIIWRMPEDVRRDFAERCGLSELMDEHALRRIFEQLEAETEVGEIDAAVRGGNARLMQAGSDALGMRGRTIHRNAKHCVGHARCLQGCPEGARQSMDVSYVPRAQKNGAQLYSLARATRIVAEHGRAEAVEGELLDDQRKVRGRFRIIGRRGVIVACGALFTPALLWKSGLRHMVGERFSAHPGAAIVGHFNEPVGMGFGATQAYEVPLHHRGMKLESLSLPPELLAARLPGAGADWQRRLHQLEYFAQWAAVVRMRALGRVRPARLFSGLRVDYEPLPEDVERIKQGAALIVRMMFAAGADEVYPGVAGVPDALTSPEQAELLLDPRLTRRDFHLMASHHFGTACAGRDPAHSVVSEKLEVHALPRLFVMDASVFPANLGVNPQHSIMGVVFRAAEWLANEHRAGRRAA